MIRAKLYCSAIKLKYGLELELKYKRIFVLSSVCQSQYLNGLKTQFAKQCSNYCERYHKVNYRNCVEYLR